MRKTVSLIILKHPSLLRNATNGNRQWCQDAFSREVSENETWNRQSFYFSIPFKFHCRKNGSAQMKTKSDEFCRSKFHLNLLLSDKKLKSKVCVSFDPASQKMAAYNSVKNFIQNKLKLLYSRILDTEQS